MTLTGDLLIPAIPSLPEFERREMFWVPGRPVPQSRARWSSVRGHMYTLKRSTQWRQEIALASIPYKPAEELQGPVRLSSWYFLPMPKRSPLRTHRMMVPHIITPDKDNLEKAVLDGLQHWWKDDCVVFAGEQAKWRVGAAYQPGLWVEVEW